jgi:hypothetical protein
MTTKKQEAPGTAGRSAVRPEDTVVSEIERLSGLGVNALRDLWSRRFGGAVPTMQSADVLRRLMAWKIQVEAFGDLDPETKTRIRQLTRAHERGAVDMSAIPSAPKTGTILVREWKGVEHRVLVLDQGFEHREKRYRSLTHVARAITGTRWSGPRFFGLEAKQKLPRPNEGTRS